MKNKKTGVLLMAFGGPDSPEAIEPFLTNLMGGRKPAPVILEKVKTRYDLIGGSSPLVQITKAQALKLEEELSAYNVQVKVGLRYWHPSIEDSLKEFQQQGFDKVIAVSLSPHFSRVSTGAYLSNVEEVMEQLQASGAKMEVTFGSSWYNHPLYIKALAKNIDSKLSELTEDQQEKTYIIFSAHSLPVAHVEGGDAYVEELKTTLYALVDQINPKHWYLAYQSKSPGQGEWLGPEVEEIMDKLPETGFENVLIVPLSFASDHIETLYDIDICQRKKAEELGLNFLRVSALNTSPEFIKALAEIVKEKL